MRRPRIELSQRTVNSWAEQGERLENGSLVRYWQYYQVKPEEEPDDE